MKKQYILKPTMTLNTVTASAKRHKKPVRSHPLHVQAPTPQKGGQLIKLGLDTHLTSITAVAQHGHLSPKAPRQFTPDQLVHQVTQWIDQGTPSTG